MMIDALTCTVDAMAEFQGPHSALSFAKSISSASERASTAASPPETPRSATSPSRHIIPAKQRSEMETIRRLQKQCLTQMQQMKSSERTHRRTAQMAKSLAARVMIRHFSRYHCALELRKAFSLLTSRHEVHTNTMSPTGTVESAAASTC